MSAEVGCPLHRCAIRAHRPIAGNVWIARHTGEAVVPLAEHYHLAVCVRINDSCGFATSVGPADIARAIFACVVSPTSIAEL
jgi:hypothetical protein